MQRVVDAARYRRLHRLGEDDPVPEVWFGEYALETRVKELRQELSSEEPCFLRAISQYFLEQITLEEYFDRLIGHLQADGVRHTFDNAKSTKLREFLEVDLIAGAVKSQMLSRDFIPLQATEASKLKQLCLVAYRTDDPNALRQEATDAETPLESLPPGWVDILAVVAYARRHLEVLRLLVAHPAPLPKSTFDHLDWWTIMNRVGGPNKDFEHSTREAADQKLCEIRHWLILLQSEGRWIHFPMTKDDHGLYFGVQRLLRFDEEPQLRAHADVERLCRVFSDKGIILGSHSLSQFLSIKTCQTCHELPRGIKPCTAAQAAMILECFPIPRVAAAESRNGRAKKLRPSCSATLLVPITQWPKNNRDRLAVMRMLLEQGCDPDDKISNNGWEAAYAPSSHRKKFDTPLHQAAERGDDQMIRLLLEFGARTDIKSGGDSRGDTPAQRAMTYQRPRTAAKIEGR